jgi:RND family efflux transporter MFP subunit
MVTSRTKIILQDKKRMASKYIKVGLPVIIIIGAVVLAVGLGSLRKPPAKVAEQRLPLLVNTAELQPQDLTYRIASQGTVTPKLETTLISEVNGRILAVADNFVAGGFFKKGDLLVQVEPADYLTAVKAAEAALAGAKAQLEEERARARVAETEWRSFTEGKAPALGLRQPQLASALANVQSKEAELERAQRDLARTEIRAPYDGMVRSRMANLGQFISRGSQLGMILGTEVAEVRLPLTDTDFGFLPQQAAMVAEIPVTLSAVVAGQAQSWQAAVVRTEGVLDERSRVIYAVAEIRDPYQLSGNAGAAFAAAQVTKVPRHLLRPGNQLLVVDQQNQLQFRPVTLNRADANYAYIGSGYQAGDRLVTSPVTNPLAGTTVRLAGEVQTTVEAETELAANSTAEQPQREAN